VAAGSLGLLIAIAGPKLAAACVVKVCRLVLEDEQLRDEAGRVALQAAQEAEGVIAAVFWSDLMKAGLQEAVSKMLERTDFQEASAFLIRDVVRDRILQDTIREGVLEALKDSLLKAEVKRVLIEGVHDQELRSALLRAANSTIKTGIREAIQDTELKEVITVAIRDALEDPRLNELLRSALKDALADKELHRATIHGAVNALNPFKKSSASERIAQTQESPQRVPQTQESPPPGNRSWLVERLNASRGPTPHRRVLPGNSQESCSSSASPLQARS